MTEHKFTDEEIKKALECCIEGEMCGSTCPYDDGQDEICECTSRLCKDSLGLINRYEAEISVKKKLLDKAEAKIEELEQERYKFTSNVNLYNELLIRTARAEAIKEFAKRLKECCRKRQYVITERTNFGVVNKQYLQVVDESDIDNLVKEMTGETKTDTDFPKDYSYGY